MSQSPQWPADTTAQQRAAIHGMIDRVLDVRPDLEAGVLNLFSAVAKKVSQPGVMASAQLFVAGKALFDALDRQPPAQPSGGGPAPTGFRAR